MELEEKIELWRSRIRECKDSGLPIIQWCEQNGFSKYTYYYWNNRVKLFDQQEMTEEKIDFVEFTEGLPMESKPDETPSLEALNEASVEICFGDVRIICQSDREAYLAAEFVGRLQQVCSRIL